MYFRNKALWLNNFLWALVVCAATHPCPCSAAKNPPATPAARAGKSNVARFLFEGDVRFNIGLRQPALELYRKAHQSETCPPGLLAAYAANGGFAERLYLDMEAAKTGDMRALRAALDRLYLGRTDPEVDPQVALALYETSKRANPKASFEGEREIAELLRMAGAPPAFDIVGFLKTHLPAKKESAEEPPAEPNPYFLWDLAEELSVANSVEKADAELVLQLVARGGGTLSERLSAVRAAFKNWQDKGPAAFSCLEHLSGPVSVRHAFRLGLAKWEREHSQRTVALLGRAREKGVGPLMERALGGANALAAEKAGHLHFSDRYSRDWQKALFLRWEIERTLRRVESAFSGSKPDLSLPPGQVLESYKVWRTAATTSLPEHLQDEDLGDSIGPCLAFPYPSDLANVLGKSESVAVECAALFARVNPSLSQEDWKGWLTAAVMREFDGSAPSLERRSQAPTNGLVAEDPARRSPKLSQPAVDSMEKEGPALEEALSAVRAGWKGEQAALFDSMREAASLWLERRASSTSGEGGPGGGPTGVLRSSLQYRWLREIQPLLAGCIPSHAVPFGFAETVLKAQQNASLGVSAAGNHAVQDGGWLEYRNRAARFLHSVSPSLREEDWKAWLSLNRAFEIPECALLFTKEERERKEDEGYSENGAESEAKFRGFEAVLKDPRSMEIDLKGMDGLVTSEDGRLRIVSWDTHTGGTMRDYCALAQFKAPDGGVGYAVLENSDNEGVGSVGVFGEVLKIETVVSDSKEAVYMIWSHGKSSAHRWGDAVTAVSLRSGRIEQKPFFQTKKNLLSRVEIEYGGEAEEAGAEFRFSKKGKPTFLVPVISDQFQFSGKFFKYEFDGKVFVFSGFQ
jgi:hypothetical protein